LVLNSKTLEEPMHEAKQMTMAQAMGAASHTVGGFSTAVRIGSKTVVGPVTALATEVFLGDPQRFTDSKRLASYVGIIPREYSSGEHQRLGGVTKQGSRLSRQPSRMQSRLRARHGGHCQRTCHGKCEPIYQSKRPARTAAAS
jgi:transposase